MTILPAVLAAIAMFGTSGSVYLSGFSASPNAPLSVVDLSPGVVHLLAPGQTTQWPIGVTTDVLQLNSLRVWVVTAHGGTGPLDRHLLISIRGCTGIWVDDRCSAKEIVVAPATTAAAWQNSQAQVVLPDRTIPRDVQLLVGVSLDRSATEMVRDEISSVTVEVSATGDLADKVESNFGLPDTAGLPNTGYALLQPLLTGFAAIAGGLFIAGLARLRTRARPR